MVFSSLAFLCIFLPIVFLLHLIVPGVKCKNAILLAGSLVFYAYGEPVYVFLLVGSAWMSYLFARYLDGRKNRGVLCVAVLFHILILLVFKYAAFLTGILNSAAGLGFPVPVIRLPIGVSFFTFQALSYVIDVYRGERAQRSFGKVLLYIAMFPQLVAGPIVQYRDVEKALGERRLTLEDTAQGLRRFLAGLSKKVLIANRLGLVADALFAAAPGQINLAGAWLGAISYMLQIYFDFSGYSDMALGLGRMFGFSFRENFSYPYVSGSIREFWRRWHISLSSWFRDYLYIPLGGNRKGELRTYLNRALVFLCTGIWHGANLTFLFWGIYHGFFLTVESLAQKMGTGRKQIKLPAFLRHLYTLLVVCIGFVIFRAETLTKGFWWIGKMFAGFSLSSAAFSFAARQLTPVFLCVLAVSVVGAMPVKKRLERWRFYEPASYLVSAAGLLLCMLQLAGNTYNPFIYFQF